MSKFITLTAFNDTLKVRYNVDHIVSYWRRAVDGSYLMLGVTTDKDIQVDRVAETPEQIDALLNVVGSPEPKTPPCTDRTRLSAEDVKWIVNDLAELGVKIGDQLFFLYKGESLTYKTDKHWDGQPRKWRPVRRLEFEKLGFHLISASHGEEWFDMPHSSGTAG